MTTYSALKDPRVKTLFEYHVLRSVADIGDGLIEERARRDADMHFDRLANDDFALTPEAFDQEVQRVVAPIRAQYEGC